MTPLLIALALWFAGGWRPQFYAPPGGPVPVLPRAGPVSYLP